MIITHQIQRCKVVSTTDKAVADKVASEAKAEGADFSRKLLRITA